MTMMVILLLCRSLSVVVFNSLQMESFSKPSASTSSLFFKLSVVDVRDDLQPNILSHAPPTH